LCLELRIGIKTVAEIIGINTTVKLMQDIPGIMINIPKTGLNKRRNQYILETYDGSKECRTRLAKRFNVTERYIIQLASKYTKKAS